MVLSGIQIMGGDIPMVPKRRRKSKNIKKQRLPGKEKCFLGTKYPIPFAELQFDVTLFPFTKHT